MRAFRIRRAAFGSSQGRCWQNAAKAARRKSAWLRWMMFRFALCADDYAITPGVSRGILQLLDAGRLTAVSVLVTGPGWAAAAGDLKPFAGATDIGLHLNLTLGAPLEGMPG